MVFKSRVDLWLGVVVLPLAASPLAIALVNGTDASRWRETWWVLSILAASAVFVAWVFLGTNYTLAERELLVRAGPLRWHVALDTLQSVRPTRNPLSSPALSLDRLELRYGRGKTLLISPADQPRFLQVLSERAPHVQRL